MDKKPRAQTSGLVKGIQLVLLLLIIIGIGLLCTIKLWLPTADALILGPARFAATNPTPTLTAPPGYIGFANDSIDEVPYGSSSMVLVPKSPLHLQFTLYTPDSPGDARLEIKNLTTITSCETGNYLINHVYVSNDEKTVLLVDYSGSSQFVDKIDTATCKAVGPSKKLP